MNDQKLAFHILYSMSAAAIAAICTVAAMVSGDRQWVVAVLIAGVVAFAALVPVLHNLWRRRP